MQRVVTGAGYFQEVTRTWRERSVVRLLLALLVIATAVPADASKPKASVAVLGLEVVDDGVSVTSESTRFARELTESMRSLPRTGRGPYSLAPGSGKDLVELKLLFGCTQETKECLAAIGEQLATDYLIYGSITRRSSSYVVTIKLFNVREKSIEKAFSDVIPEAEAAGASVRKWGQRMYDRISATVALGLVTVTANVARGKLKIDGEPAGELIDGAATLQGLPPGRRRIEIEADDYAAFTTTFEVEEGKDIVVEAKLVSASVASGSAASQRGKSGKGAKIAFFGSVAVAGGAAAGAIVSGLEVRRQEDALRDAIVAYRAQPGKGTAFPANTDACSNTPSDATAVSAACSAGDSAARRSNLLWGFTGVAIVGAGVSYYLGWVRPKSRARAEGAAWSVQPQVGSQTGLQVRWQF